MTEATHRPTANGYVPIYRELRVEHLSPRNQKEAFDQALTAWRFLNDIKASAKALGLSPDLVADLREAAKRIDGICSQLGDHA